MIRRCFILAVVGLAAVAALASPVAVAQELQAPRPRQGYYMGVGGHGAVNHNWEKGDALGVFGGAGMSLRVGQLLTPRLGLGLQLEQAVTAGAGQLAALYGLGLEVQWEILPDLAVTASVGLGVLSLADPDEPDEPLRGVYGTSYGIGLSYDRFVTRRDRTGGLAIVPTIQLRFAPGDVAAAASVFGGVQLVYWTGLPSNQLDLPPAEAYQASGRTARSDAP